VPHRPDKSDASALPDPELNPLLNPLLAAHMGRWAEVYFTNPPEKREQAVSDLLRELENVPPESASLPVANGSAGGKTHHSESPHSSPATLDLVLTCSVCAYNNPAEQRFCGMCAAPLQVSPNARVPQVAEAAPNPGASWCERALGSNSVEDALDPAVRSTVSGAGGDVRGLTWLLPEKNLPRSGVKSRHSRYRKPLYVAVVLATLLAILGYMAWRGKEARTSAAAPRSAPARAIPTAQPAPSTSAGPLSATASALPTSTPPASTVQNRSQPEATSGKDRAPDSRPAARITPVVSSSSAIAAPRQSGAQELATAEKYLNGTLGVTRDSGEAAQWLWKAVRKRNLEATLVLSDLYLRGDGVPKSCDQARLLLDAAARKGERAAAERLRNLQAFGCQ
jgi:hypothetical protein